MKIFLILLSISGTFQQKIDKENNQEFDLSKFLNLSSNLCPPGDQIIPKIFHQVWLDFGKGSEIPPNFQNYTNRLLEIHKGWDYILWTEQMALNLIKEHFPNFLSTYISYDVQRKRHDSIKIAVLYVFGGVYLDHNIISVKNIESALGICEIVFGSEEDWLKPGNAIMASVANSSLMRVIIQLMNNEDIANQHTFHATGPDMLLNGLKTFFEMEGKTSIKIYTMNFFYPPIHYFIKNKFKPTIISEIYPECFFYQLYDGSLV